MASLNTSLSFFFATFALCQVARRAAKALLPGGTYARFAREVMRTLGDVGPWGGGFGPDLLLTPLFLLLLLHGAALDGASADPAVSLQEFLLAEASLPGTLLDLAAQALGMQAACALTRLYWAWELSDMRVLQTLTDVHCGSGSCAFLFRLTLLRCRNSLPVYRVLAGALLVTIMAYTAGPLTSASFNPALAASVTFHCSGHTLLEYAQVYWLGPLTGKGLRESLGAGGQGQPWAVALIWGTGMIRKAFQVDIPEGFRSCWYPECFLAARSCGEGRGPGQ
uniref:Aquaporin n=1 Tax=Balaenoptera musculus TaxID=9771 RepID=A0A8C0HXB7_BALMU